VGKPGASEFFRGFIDDAADTLSAIQTIIKEI